MTNQLIEAKGLTKSYTLDGLKSKVLHGVDLTVDEGDFIAITGPSGGGKSTLLSLLGLLETADSGSYLLQGKNIVSFNDEFSAAVRNQFMGYVFQSFNLIPQLRVWENIALPLTYQKKINKTERKEKAINCLDKVGLRNKAEHFPNQLSGGQQQRAAIARALISNPKVIFADEPTGNLDSANGRLIMDEFARLNTLGQTIVMVTHNPNELKYASKVVTVSDGLIK